MREQCEVKGQDCEVFTRCVRLVDTAGVLVACPTCAIALGMSEVLVTQIVTRAVEGTEPRVCGGSGNHDGQPIAMCDECADMPDDEAVLSFRVGGPMLRHYVSAMAEEHYGTNAYTIAN